jgi:hypothetical protein
MASPAQILANRLNSQKSTGPRSVEGKAASSMNALQHGARAESRIIPGEDVQALAQLAEAYRQEYQPDGPEEELLLDTIIRADWTQRRMARLEAEVFHAFLSQSPDSSTSPGAAFLNDASGPNALQKIYRRQQSASREWYRARIELRRLQEDRLHRSARRHPSERTQFALENAPHRGPSSPPIPNEPNSAESASRTKSDSPAPAPDPFRTNHDVTISEPERPSPRIPTEAVRNNRPLRYLRP